MKEITRDIFLSYGPDGENASCVTGNVLYDAVCLYKISDDLYIKEIIVNLYPQKYFELSKEEIINE